jgi:uncharacterized membrane protein YedE/YeeE
MELTIHQQVLGSAVAIGLIIGGVSSKTNFCTLGAVSDWVNMGDTARMRSWLLAIAVAILGVTLLDAAGVAVIGTDTFPPYQTANFAWLRYLVGGLMFGAGMTLASGCGNKTLVRIGNGNIKSLIVLIIASLWAYAMLWTDFYGVVFNPLVAAATIDLATYGVRSQSVGDLLGISRTVAGSAIGLAIFLFVVAGKDFRQSADAMIGGFAMGVAVTVGWWVTGGTLGNNWKEFADFADVRPLRVDTQSLTFVSPMGDLVHFLLNPMDVSLLNFGIMGMIGVVLGSFIFSAWSRQIRLEYFASGKDFANHVLGASLMGVGGVLAMGCTIGQGVTGVSTLAIGSLLAFLAMIAGAAAMIKYMYWRIMRET